MDLVSGSPIWPLAAGALGGYLPLSQDEECQVAIVGAGITGALVAHRLAEAGIDVVVVDRREVASGSTAASTALVTWELDIGLADLADRIGIFDAVRAYRVSLDAVSIIERLATSLPDDCGFARRPSLYLASGPEDVEELDREAALRARQGFPSELWSASRLSRDSPFRAPAAIRSEGTAQVDPYRLTHGLLRQAIRKGARVYAETEVVDEIVTRDGLVLRTGRGPIIRAGRSVIAMGYEVPKPLKSSLVRLSSTYAIATEPVPDFGEWTDRCLVWESARPYAYLRTTQEGHIVMGGADEPFSDEDHRDRLIPEKAEQLCRRLREWLPALQPQLACAWTGTFGESPDGLPYIGSLEQLPGRTYALGYGGNGITFGAVAADQILRRYQGDPLPDARLFRLDR